MTNKELDVVIARALEINRQNEMIKALRELMKNELARNDEDEEDCEQFYRLDVGRTLAADDGTIERFIACEKTIYVSADELDALIEGIRFKTECLRQNLKEWIQATANNEEYILVDERGRYTLTEEAEAADE